jgi:hypothetical protein
LKFNQFRIEDNIDQMVRIQWDISIF